MPRPSTRTRAAGARANSSSIGGSTSSTAATPRRRRVHAAEDEEGKETKDSVDDERTDNVHSHTSHAHTNGYHKHTNGNGSTEQASEDESEEEEIDVDELVKQAHQAMTSSLSSSSSSSLATPRTVQASASSSSPPVPSSASSATASAVDRFIPPPPQPLFTRHSHLFQLTQPNPPTPQTTVPPPPPTRSPATASHYSLPTPPLTAELKRDLRLLALRPYLDPKRFYKRSERKPSHFPSQFAVGTVVESSEGWYNRETTGERREWWVQGVREEGGQWLKRKFEEVQDKNRGRERGRERGRGKKHKGRR